MATWAERSFALAASGGYLDRLAEIYPAPTPVLRTLSSAHLKLVEDALCQSDDCLLLEPILRLTKFPFNDPYVSFLRENPEAVRNNPQTIKRICGRLRELGVEGVVRGLEEPKQFNRQMGAMFNKWLHSRYSFVSDIAELKASAQPVVFLEGSGEKLRDFANQTGGCGLQKQPDFAAKIKSK